METPQPTPTRSTRERNPPKRYIDFVSSVLFTDDGEPSCFQEAIDCVDNAKWKMAMKEEMDSLEKNKTWESIELPKDRKIVGCKRSSSWTNVLMVRLRDTKTDWLQKGTLIWKVLTCWNIVTSKDILNVFYWCTPREMFYSSIGMLLVIIESWGKSSIVSRVNSTLMNII